MLKFTIPTKTLNKIKDWTFSEQRILLDRILSQNFHILIWAALSKKEEKKKIHQFSWGGERKLNKIQDLEILSVCILFLDGVLKKVNYNAFLWHLLHMYNVAWTGQKYKSSNKNFEGK